MQKIEETNQVRIVHKYIHQIPFLHGDTSAKTINESIFSEVQRKSKIKYFKKI